MAKKKTLKRTEKPKKVKGSCSTAGSKLAKHGYSSSGAMLGSSKCKS